MSNVETKNIRNCAIIGHGGDGKTSITEAVLYLSGVNSRLGKVDDGSSLMDFEPEEINRKGSILASIANFPWLKNLIYWIDTPGYANFIGDTKACLRAVDSAVVVVAANDGVKVQTTNVWNYTNEYEIPRIVFINRMDADRANFESVFEDIESNFKGIRFIPLFYPIGKEAGFKGIVDLLSRKALLFSEDASGKFEMGEVPEDIAGPVDTFREKMIESLVEADDALMEKYLDGNELTNEELLSCLKKGTLERQFVPVACGSAVKNIGIPQLLDLVVNALPSPLDKGPAKGKKPGSDEEILREPNAEAPFSAFVFKTLSDPFAGRLTIFRIYSGTVHADSTLYNATKDIKERIGQIFRLVGKKQEGVGSAFAGELIAVAKLKETATGDTFCDENDPIIYEPAKLPQPLITFALTPKSRGDEDKVASSLQRLMEEDLTIHLGRDDQTREILLTGMGQVHIEATLEKLKRKFGVEVELSTPKVPYKETIKKTKKGVIYRHKKQTGGHGQFAEVHFDISPLKNGETFEFENALTGMNVPRGFVPAVEKGIVESMQSGVLAGYPVVGVKVRFYDGKSHEVDSSEMAFKIASAMCFKNGVKEAQPVLLEPIMDMEVTVPEDALGDVIGDINGRRGKVLGMDTQGKYQIVKASVPMAEILKYAPDLRSITGGRGTFTVEFSHYEEVPAQLKDKIIAQKKAAEEE
jgi:elongation factor G